MQITQFYDDLQDLGKVDWPLMRSKYWFDSDEDPDRARRRQAEFLTHGFVPLALIGGIAVMTESTAMQVQEVLQAAECAIPVQVIPGWYYE